MSVPVTFSCGPRDKLILPIGINIDEENNFILAVDQTHVHGGFYIIAVFDFGWGSEKKKVTWSIEERQARVRR